MPPLLSCIIIIVSGAVLFARVNIFACFRAIHIVSLADTLNALIEVCRNEDADSVLEVAQHIVGRTAYEDATVLGSSLPDGIALKLIKRVLGKVVLIEVVLSHEWYMQMKERLEEAFPLIVLLKEFLAESALLSSEVQQFLVVELASERVGKHLGNDSAAGAYLPANIDDDLLICIIHSRTVLIAF